MLQGHALEMVGGDQFYSIQNNYTLPNVYFDYLGDARVFHKNWKLLIYHDISPFNKTEYIIEKNFMIIEEDLHRKDKETLSELLEVEEDKFQK